MKNRTILKWVIGFVMVSFAIWLLKQNNQYNVISFLVGGLTISLLTILDKVMEVD